MAVPEFIMTHYAGKVTYNTVGFLQKNRDVLAIEVNGAMAIASNHIVALIFGGEEGAIGGKTKKIDAAKAVAKAKQSTKNLKGKRTGGMNASFLARQFKASLVSLMDDLNKAEPHLIRCIKPNQAKSKDWDIDSEYSTRQLRYTGMLDTTRIRREGYPSRPTFADFLERYKILGHPMSKEVPSTGPSCQEILSHANVEDAKIGKTKVFMKHYHGRALDEMLKPFSSAAMLIGKFGVGFLARARCKPLIEYKRKQDTLVKAWLDTIPKLANPFTVAQDATKVEDGEVMAALWKKREEENKPPPESHAKADAAVAAEAKRGAANASAVKTGKPTRDQVIDFYKEMGDQQGAGQTEDGRFCAWFHGIVSRKEAESLLCSEQDGTFLIRLAESRYVSPPPLCICTTCGTKESPVYRSLCRTHSVFTGLATRCLVSGADESSILQSISTTRGCTRSVATLASIGISIRLSRFTTHTRSPTKATDCSTRATQEENVTISTSLLRTMMKHNMCVSPLTPALPLRLRR
jgi:myosin-3